MRPFLSHFVALDGKNPVAAPLAPDLGGELLHSLLDGVGLHILGVGATRLVVVGAQGVGDGEGFHFFVLSGVWVFPYPF